MKICILGNGFIGWGGGLDFLRNIVNSLLAIKDEKEIEVNVLIHIKQENRYFVKIKDIIKKYIFKRNIENEKQNNQEHIDIEIKRAKDFFSNCDGNVIIDTVYGNIEEFEKYLLKNNYDVVFPCIDIFPKQFKVKWIGYIADFQHKYYPKYFSKKEINVRNKHFNKIINNAKQIVVNSKDVKNDIMKFYPNTKAKVYSLPLSPVPVKKWLEEINIDLYKKYNLPKNYFMVSNQFWKHKSHMTVFETIKKLKDRGIEIVVIFTGDTSDYRFPNYYSEIQEYILKNNIQENVRILGLIPKLEQINIMKNAIAVIQPTLFEGGPGGGAAYDAISLGVPLILSDIRINKEIEEKDVYFFEIKNSDSLSKEIINVLNKNKVYVSNREILDRGFERKRKLGNYIFKLLEEK